MFQIILSAPLCEGNVAARNYKKVVQKTVKKNMVFYSKVQKLCIVEI